MQNRLLLLFLSSILMFTVTAQEGNILTPTEKAYLFHTVRKSPILQHSLGRYLSYLGKKPTFPNGQLNYDSIEYRITNNPELLKIYYYDIRRSPKGILSELTNKMALWELNQTLQSRRDNTLLKKGLSSKFEAFKKILISHLPQEALHEKNGAVELRKRIINLSNPALTFNDKVAMVSHFASWTKEQQMQVIIAYNKAINQWVEKRSEKLYTLLGGKADTYINILTAAGDGSNTSGMFEDRERKENGWWNKGLSSAVGFFPYEPQIRELNNAKKRKKKTEIVPTGYTIHQFSTVGHGKETNIHLDVWGYNSKKQTTVVIEKGNKYYPLFGSKDSRFLSPDSTFGGGTTYYTIIHQIQKDRDALEEKLSGKKGIEYWIAFYKDKKTKTILAIQKSEMDLYNVRQNAYSENPKKMKYDKNRNGGKKQKDRDHRKDVQILFKDDPVKGARNKGMDDVTHYQNQLEAIKRKIAKLEEEKKKILAKKQVLDVQIQVMTDRIGRADQWECFKENDGLYIYEDSARFDLRTQEFTFPARDTQEVVEVKLLPIPVSHINLTQFDEVMLHVNVTDAVPLYTSQIKLNINDKFGVDQYKLDSVLLIKPKDSLAVMEFFDALYNKKKSFDIITRGGGIGKWEDHHAVMNYRPKEIANYPGASAEERQKSKQDSIFKRLRTTELIIHVNRKTLLEVNSFTDPVRSHFQPKNEKLLKAMEKYHLSENQMLSAYRAYTTLSKLREKLNVLAGKYLSREKAAKVIDRLNKSVYKSKITVGPTSLKYKWFSE